MDTKHLYGEPLPTTSTMAGFWQRRLVLYTMVFGLFMVLVGFLFALGHVSSPFDFPHVASAKANQPDVLPTTKQPAAERLLSLSPGDIPLLQSLQERQNLLDAREQKLLQKEEELHQLKQYVEKKFNTLSMLRQEIGALIEEKEAFEARRFEHLVKVYEGMKPAEAAPLVERLNEETSVKLFYRMKEKKVSQILGFLKPDIAAHLSERLAAEPQPDQETPAQETQP